MIITLVNQKGGVAKTTTAVTLGHGLAMARLTVLIVDTDPQGHVATCLGLSKADGFKRWVVDDEPIQDIVVTARPGLDIIPGDKNTEKAKRYISAMDYREHVLTNLLADLTYDVILIDLAPSLDVVHVAALVAADWLIIPTKLDPLAIDGVNEVLRSYTEVQYHGGKIQGYNILPTMFDRTTNETKEQLHALADHFPQQLLPPIPTDTKAREASAYGQTLWEYCPSSPAIRGYAGLGGYAELLAYIQELYHGQQ